MKFLETGGNSLTLIEKAKDACIAGTGQNAENHFPDIGKVIEVGKGKELILYRCLPYDFFAHHKTCIKSCKYSETIHETTQKIAKKYPDNVGHTLKESAHD